MAKLKTIKLVGPIDRIVSYSDQNPDGRPRTAIAYRVVQVTDSIEFAPEQLIDKPTVQEMCDSAAWKVTIISAATGR